MDVGRSISQDSDSYHAYIWGHGEDYNLGLGDEEDRLEPVMLKRDDTVDVDSEGREIPSSGEWKHIACGFDFGLGITANGEICSWGNRDSFGHPKVGEENENEYVPKPKLLNKTWVPKRVKHVSCGLDHTAFLTTEGELYTCGNGQDGQLGHANTNNYNIPTKVEGLTGHVITDVSTGEEYTIALTSEGLLFSFGTNFIGRTGLGSYRGDQLSPERIMGCLEGKRVRHISACKGHTACICEDGETYTWGSGDCGQLGHDDIKHRSAPKHVSGLAGLRASAVACGSAHTLVVAGNGRVYSFGWNKYGQLGHGDRSQKQIPTIIDAPLEGKVIQQVACGTKHSIALSTAGIVFSWGCGANGILGHGSETVYSFPSIVEGLAGLKVAKIISQDEYSVALVEPSKERSYSKKMKLMVDDKSCSDVEFILKNDERVHANKGILIGQSKYFRAMFRSNMRESRDNVIEVRDCPKDVFLLFLEYLYSDSVDIALENAMDLYMLSDRYQENHLCQRCVDVLKKELNAENAMTLLVDADGLGSVGAELKSLCMDYVVSNYTVAFKKELVNTLPPTLKNELLCDIFDRDKKNEENAT